MKRLFRHRWLLLAPLLTSACSLPVTNQSLFASKTPPRNSIVASPDLDQIRRFDRIEKEIGPLERAMDSDLEAGRWADALAKLDSIEPRWTAERRPLHYLSDRAEALIGEGRATQALDLLEAAPKQEQDQVPLTLDLARALCGQLDPATAFAHAESARLRYDSGDAPPLKRPASSAQIVACVRLDRAVEHRNVDVVAEREAREALKGYPKSPLASYILADAVGNGEIGKPVAEQTRIDEEMKPYWLNATKLPGIAGERAKETCHDLFPDRPEFMPPPPRTVKEWKGEMTPSLRATVDAQRAYAEQFRKR